MRQTILITTTALCLIAATAAASVLPFEKDGEPFYAPKFNVVWAATNRLPATVRVFKVVRASFSPAAISNLIAMGGSAVPKEGAMNLYKTMDARLPLEHVPDKTRAFELATNILARLEIPTSELVTQGGKLRAGYSPGARGHMDKATRAMVTEPCTMGIEFRRRLDGFECFGQQVYIQFETRETVTQLEVRWHGLQPVKSYPVASPDQIITWIKEGQARAQSVETTGSRWIKVADIKQVKIQDIEFYYDATPDAEDLEKSPTELYPCALLSAEVEFSPDDHETIGLFCPIIKEALSRPVRKSGEFNIYPSNLRDKQALGEVGR